MFSFLKLFKVNNMYRWGKTIRFTKVKLIVVICGSVEIAAVILLIHCPKINELFHACRFRVKSDKMHVGVSGTDPDDSVIILLHNGHSAAFGCLPKTLKAFCFPVELE